MKSFNGALLQMNVAEMKLFHMVKNPHPSVKIHFIVYYKNLETWSIVAAIRCAIEGIDAQYKRLAVNKHAWIIKK